MNCKWINFFLTLGASVALAVTSASSYGQATVVVDDNVAVDGTASLDAQYFFSSSNNGLEINPNSIGLVSGGSGRPIHGVFPAVTLSEIGDTLTLSFTFMTPATVGIDEDDGLRIGLFDTLGRETPLLDETTGEQVVIDGVPQTEGVFGNILASSNPATGPGPNEIYGIAGVNDALPGFAIAYDSNDMTLSGPNDEIQIRQAIIAEGSGRFLTTNDGFEIIADEAADDGTGVENLGGFLANTMYSGFVEIERISATELVISTFIDNLPGFPQPELAGDPVVVTTLLVPDDMPDPTSLRDFPAVADSFTFDVFAFQAGSSAFGSSNTPGTPDNGLDFLSISIETTGDVELPATTVGDFDGNGVVDCDDLDGYVGNLGTAATGAAAALDFDSDGFLSPADADSVLTTLVVAGGVAGTFPGDFNCDGEVNVLGDAFILVGSLGGPATMYSQGDANFDGQVNVLGDAFVLVANLGSSNQ